MKLVSYWARSEERYGVRTPLTSPGGDATILDLPAAFALAEAEAGGASDAATISNRFGRDLLGFLERAAHAGPAADGLLARALAGDLPASWQGAPILFGESETSPRPPLPRPPSIRDGYAFRQHVETARQNRGLPMIPEFDEFPVFYFTNHCAVTGPGPVVVQPLHLDKLDYELEIAAVIGQEGTNLSVAEADACIFGLTIMNDWSARGLQMAEMKLNLGPAKGKDFATSLGPWLVTADELEPCRRRGPRGSQFDLEMTAAVNGTLQSRGNARDMHWTFAEIIARASYGVTLYPGDVIGSGTVGTGCLLELNGTRGTSTWLAPGDVVDLRVDRLGSLVNEVVLARAEGASPR